MIRLCVSGIAWCSGLNPCEQCHAALMGRVIPRAMIAGGFNNEPEVAKAFLDTYRREFRDVQAEAMAALQAQMATEQARMEEEQKKLAGLAAAAMPPVAAQEMPREVPDLRREVSGVGGEGKAGTPATTLDETGAARGPILAHKDAPARLDADAKSKPMTEIVAVMPPGAVGEHDRTVHVGQATHYIARPTAEGIAPPTADTTHPTTTETLPLPEPPADTTEAQTQAPPAAPLPLPMVEGLENSEEETSHIDEAPSSDTVIAAKRRRGLPRIARGPKRKPSMKAATK